MQVIDFNKYQIDPKSRGLVKTFLQPHRSIQYGSKYLIKKERYHTNRLAKIEVWSVYVEHKLWVMFKTRKAAEQYVQEVLLPNN